MMNIQIRNISSVVNYISFDTIKNVDTRIWIVAAFILGYLVRFITEPTRNTVLKPAKAPLKKADSSIRSGFAERVKNSKANVATVLSISKIKDEVQEADQPELQPTQVQLDDVSKPLTTQEETNPIHTIAADSNMIKQPSKPRKTRKIIKKVAKPIPDVSSVTKKKDVSICFKNILKTEGKISNEFMSSFVSQVETHLKDYAVNRYDLEQTPLSKLSGDKVLLYFNLPGSRLQPTYINSYLRNERFDKSCDCPILILSKFSIDEDLMGVEDIDHDPNASDKVNRIFEIESGVAVDSSVSTSENCRVAKSVADYVIQRF